MSVIAPAVSEIRAKPSDTFCLLHLLLESTSGRFYIGDTRLKNKSTNLLKVTPRHQPSQNNNNRLPADVDPGDTTNQGGPSQSPGARGPRRAPHRR